MRRSDLVQNDQHSSSDRTTQIVFGERQHLLRVLDSLEGSQLPSARRNHERRVLEELIHARTKELNEVNSSWDADQRAWIRSHPSSYLPTGHRAGHRSAGRARSGTPPRHSRVQDSHWHSERVHATAIGPVRYRR